MSKVHIALHQVRAYDASPRNSPLPAVESVPFIPAVVVTSSGTSQAASITAPAGSGAGIAAYLWVVTNMGTDDVYVSFSGAPATSANSVALAAGTTRFVSATQWSESPTIINA